MVGYTLGIDIGGTNFRLGLVSELGEITDFVKKSSRLFDQGNAVEHLHEEIVSYLKQIEGNKEVLAVAIGVPSMVSRDKKTIYSTPNLKSFDRLYFGDTLENRLGIPVFLERDVNFLLQNDMVQLALGASKTVLGFYIGTGLGNAIYLHDDFFSGKNGAAGELGHIPLYGVEGLCTCGNHACSELRCSGRYLESLVATHFPDTAVADSFAQHAEDPILQTYVEDLAIPIATEINILDPDYCVIAGGVVFMKDFPKQHLVDAIHRHCRKPYPLENLELFFSNHTQESGVLGAGSYAHKMVSSKKSINTGG